MRSIKTATATTTRTATKPSHASGGSAMALLLGRLALVEQQFGFAAGLRAWRKRRSGGCLTARTTTLEAGRRPLAVQLPLHRSSHAPAGEDFSGGWRRHRRMPPPRAELLGLTAAIADH
jgi:hypothetical protein